MRYTFFTQFFERSQKEKLPVPHKPEISCIYTLNRDTNTRYVALVFNTVLSYIEAKFGSIQSHICLSIVQLFT
jgi:hypothetical protein